MATAGGQKCARVQDRRRHGQRTKTPPEPGKNGTKIMTRNIVSLILITTFAAAVSMKADPTPSADRTPSRKAVTKTVPAPLAEGWNYLRGEWIHSDGYKYLKGQVIRTAAQTHNKPPRPPSKALLDSVKTKPTATPDPNSAAAKAAEKERNLRPRPAPQTGTHL
jgi:hypothetical protein